MPLCYPNPFNSSVIFKVKIFKREKYSLYIYDNFGRIVNNIFNGILYPGEYNYKWNGINNMGLAVSSGVYFAVLTSQSRSKAQKMLLVR